MAASTLTQAQRPRGHWDSCSWTLFLTKEFHALHPEKIKPCCDRVTWLLCSIVKVKPRSRAWGTCSGPGVVALSPAPGVQPSAPRTLEHRLRAAGMHSASRRGLSPCRAELSGVGGEAERSSLGARDSSSLAVLSWRPSRRAQWTHLPGEGNKGAVNIPQQCVRVVPRC